MSRELRHARSSGLGRLVARGAAIGLGAVATLGPLASCASSAGDGAASVNTPAVRVTTTVGEDVTPSGFARVDATITTTDGARRTVCLWLADDDTSRAEGLQSVTSLGECPGMAFVFAAPVEHRFWMRDTLIPLTITFWDEAGGWVSAADMVPCPPAAADCPRTAAAGPYQVAVEVPAGEADELGLVRGSRLELER